MKPKIFYILIFFLGITSISFTTYGNTKEYCEKFFDSVKVEYSQKNYTKCIELLTEIKTLSETNNWNDLKIKSLNNLGVIYQHISDFEKAMEYYLEAYRAIGDNPDEKRIEGIVLNNIAGLYATDKQYDKATDYFQKALVISQQAKDTAGMMHIMNNLGSIANETNDMDLAIQYANSSLKLSQNILTDRTINAQQIKATALYQKNDYAAAEKLALGAFQQIQEYNIEYQYTISLILLITKIYQEQNKGNQALAFVRKAMDYTPSLKDLIDIYEQMAILYQKNHYSDLALTYKDSVILLKDSLHKINAVDNIENSRIRFELLNSEKELSENKAKQKMERRFFIFLFIGIFIFAVVLVWIFRIQSIRNKQKKIIAELELKEEKNEKLLLGQQLKEQETLALLEQEKLNNEIDAKNSQLTAKILSHSNRHEWIKEILQSFSEIPDKSKNSALEAIIRKLKLELSDSAEWDNFLMHFEQMNPLLLSSLRNTHPNLTANDIQLLSCIYLNLDTKKIAYLLNVSTEAYQKRKERLAAKMEVKVTDLYNYLQSFVSK
jgi:tetratricopeptide (TPR) repeat protein